MATKTTQKDKQDTFVAPHEKLALRAEAQKECAEGIRLEKLGAWTLGHGLSMAEGTFDQSETKQWHQWAEKHTGRSWETCRSYLAAYRASEGMRLKSQKDKAKSLPIELGQVLASTDEADREKFLAAISPTTTPTDARKVRDELAESHYTEAERKQRAAEKVKREKKRAAEKGSTLQEAIRDEVLAYLERGDVGRAMVFGAVLAESRKGEKVAEAIGAILSKREKAQKVLAEQEKKHQRELAAAARSAS